MTALLKIKFGTSVLEFEFMDTMSVGDAKEELSSAHHLRVDTVRLIVQGRVLNDSELLNAYKHSSITMVASTLKQKIEDDTPRHMRQRLIDDLTETPKEFKAKPLTLNDSHFGAIKTLDGLPMKEKAYSILLSLATDRGIVGIMKKYGWNVPVLAEMYPEGEVGISEVCILGLNENKGQRILLRIRTDDLEGFRRYDNIRQVLIHELTHNVHGDHDNKFYTLMRQLQKESVALDPFGGKGRRSDGTVGRTDRYQGSDVNLDKDNADTAHVLDQDHENNGVFRLLPANLMAGTAALTRLTRDEQAVEDGCACGPSAGHSSLKSMDALPAEAMESMEVCLPCNKEASEDETASRSTEGGEIQGSDAAPQGAPAPAPAPAPALDHIDSDNVRKTVVEMFDQAIAMNQEFLGSDYATSKLSTMCSLLIGMLSTDSVNRGPADNTHLFESVKEALSLLVRILKGTKEGEAKRSLNKASKAITKLQAVPGGMELLLCLGFTQAEGEGKLVMRLFDESFNYISTSLLERTLDCIAPDATPAQC